MNKLSLRSVLLAALLVVGAITLVLVGAMLVWDKDHSYLIIVCSFLAIVAILSAASAWFNRLCRKNKGS